MSSQRRVLLIARRYWPNTCDNSLRLSALAHAFIQSDCEATVMTPRWHTQWPMKFLCDDVPVVRIDSPPINTFKTRKHIRSMTKWLQAEERPFDLVYSDDSHAETVAALHPMPSPERPPLVCRAPMDLINETSSDEPYTHLNPTTLKFLRKAAAIVSPCSVASSTLLANGIMRDRIIIQPAPIAEVIDRSREKQVESRQTLREINHDLIVRMRERVVVVPGNLDDTWQIGFLIDALRHVVERHRSLRLWILGDGPLREKFYERLRFHGLHHAVVMPGIFPDPREVLRVADICLFTAQNVGLGWLLPSCVASSIPVLYADSAMARECVGDAAFAKSLPAFAHDAWASEVERFIESPEQWCQQQAVGKSTASSQGDNSAQQLAAEILKLCDPTSLHSGITTACE